MTDQKKPKPCYWCGKLARTQNAPSPLHWFAKCADVDCLGHELPPSHGAWNAPIHPARIAAESRDPKSILFKVRKLNEKIRDTSHGEIQGAFQAIDEINLFAREALSLLNGEGEGFVPSNRSKAYSKAKREMRGQP